jgi:hypothetical protein
MVGTTQMVLPIPGKLFYFSTTGFPILSYRLLCGTVVVSFIRHDCSLCFLRFLSGFTRGNVKFYVSIWGNVEFYVSVYKQFFSTNNIMPRHAVITIKSQKPQRKSVPYRSAPTIYIILNMPSVSFLCNFMRHPMFVFPFFLKKNLYYSD